MISVLEAHNRFIPVAQVLDGSVIIHTSWGLTRAHALGRAAWWARKQSGDASVRVGKWADAEDLPPKRVWP